MSQSLPDSFPIKPRFGVIDAIKGVAILLVVFGHTVQGGMHRQLWDHIPRLANGLNFTDVFIYSFHMPAFFFVAGLFLEKSVERRGRLDFILEKCRTLLYPYILWCLLSFIIDPLTAPFRLAATQPTWQERVYAIVSGNASWFLVTLFLSQMLVLLILRFPHWLQTLLATGIALLVPISDVTIFYKPLQYLPFLVAGMWISQNRIPMLEEWPKRLVWLGFAALLMVQLAAIALGPQNRWTLVPFGLVGIFMLVLFCLGIQDTPGERIMIWCGEASLAIFLLSGPFQGMGREFVTRVLHTNNPVPYLSITSLFGIIFPALLWVYKEKLHIVWLFRWPSRTTPSVSSKREPIMR
ncbi:MAG TPA: acyltransferase family protein [Terracidiphilus sp.]|jgi:fucose 4-O-acetylase-like acetyltransferase